MRVYLAGAVTGNLNPLYAENGKRYEQWLQKGNIGNMRLFLAGRRPWKEQDLYDSVIYGESDMKLFLAGEQRNRSGANIEFYKNNGIFILESFYYIDKWTEIHLPIFGDFLLDSGAFTFFSNGRTQNVNWKEYISKYCAFINKYKIDKFFELDIDLVVGYDKVLDFRKMIEDKTGKAPIVVWHSNRKKDGFIKMCEDYKYVAIGLSGVNAESKTLNKNPHMIKWFIDFAHTSGCKIHGLGCTALKMLSEYKFDSVDSSSWTCGNRFGYIFVFNGRTLIQHKKKMGQRLLSPKQAALHNFTEWVKFQKYAEVHL